MYETELSTLGIELEKQRKDFFARQKEFLLKCPEKRKEVLSQLEPMLSQIEEINNKLEDIRYKYLLRKEEKTDYITEFGKFGRALTIVILQQNLEFVKGYLVRLINLFNA